MSPVSRLRDSLTYHYDRAILGMTNDLAIDNPADFAELASGGRWLYQPHLFPINRKLVHAAKCRLKGTSYRLLITLPPQHGKSTLVDEYFPGFWFGHFPDDPIVLAAYEANFAADWGRVARDAFEIGGPKAFGLHLDPEVAAASHWKVKGHAGTMSTAGDGGAITGKPAKLFLIDDPIKNMDEARSELFRNNSWDWLIRSVITRLHNDSVLVMIYTPWHDDDLGQRIIRAAMEGNLEPWDILRIPAIAESQEDRDDWCARNGLPIGQADPVGRKEGEALWPAKHSLEKLEMFRKTDPIAFESMYQGRPRARGGSYFMREWFKERMVRRQDIPADAEYCRFWDKAASEDKGDYTVGALMARDIEGRYYLVNIARFRHGVTQRDRLIRAICDADRDMHQNVRIRGEEEGGSAGKTDAEAFIRLMDGHNVKTVRATGEKSTRGLAYCSQAGGGNVWIVKDVWNDAYFDEMEAFDKGRHDDQWDASAGSFNELAGQFAAEWGEDPFAGYRGRVAIAG